MADTSMLDTARIDSTPKSLQQRALAYYRRQTLPLRAFQIIVVIPTILAGFYYGFIASDIYVAEARYAVRTSSEMPASGIIDAVLGNSGGTIAGEDQLIVRDYILSRDMLEELDRRLNLREHYASPDVDWWARLPADASLEDFVKYYQDMIEVGNESGSYISTITVRAFDPVMAQNIAAEIIELSEELVNRMSDRIVADTLRFASGEVDAAEARVKRASAALTRFRSENRSIDPGQETSAVLGIVTELESRLAGARAELLEAESYMQADSAQVQTLKSRVEALKQQVVSERKRLASESGASNDYTRLIDDYEPLLLEQKLAEQRYTSTLNSLEIARAEAQRKQRYLIPFVQPKQPDEAIEPDRVIATLTVFAACFLVYCIGALIWSAIKDHMRV